MYARRQRRGRTILNEDILRRGIDSRESQQGISDKSSSEKTCTASSVRASQLCWWWRSTTRYAGMSTLSGSDRATPGLRSSHCLASLTVLVEVVHRGSFSSQVLLSSTPQYRTIPKAQAIDWQSLDTWSHFHFCVSCTWSALPPVCLSQSTCRSLDPSSVSQVYSLATSPTAVDSHQLWLLVTYQVLFLGLLGVTSPKATPPLFNQMMLFCISSFSYVHSEQLHLKLCWLV